ncbi:MAG TPA: folylpolyglutamate synthase/dihydrofolate synthase family protein [Acidobacteriaceae bacterium]|jgi:dihydrofolate synthase/folylpolyglutamate synthase|nr:folylpolyglutamate synthase/dihydrofolate synthase family protein [Acidobacteriaceae bacterium]
MSYAAAVEHLYALGHELAPLPGNARRKFDLDQMRLLAEALGHPELGFPSVLIAGTNGKGSTAATLASILRAGGYRTALYTSPHLTRVNERIQIDGVEISDDDFARLYFRVDEAGTQLVAAGKLPQHPSFFEAITALAFLYFAEQKVDFAVLEVGMGGRLDATNIVEPLLSIVTDISIDHTEWLGPTLQDIAREKAGILRRNGVLVTLSQHPDANQVLGEVAMELNVTGVNAAEYLPPHDATAWSATYPVTVLGETIELALPLAGTHQHRNVALAIAAATVICNRHGYKLTAEAVATGVRETRWPGRLERFTLGADQSEVLLDVAHNPAGAWTLRSALSAYPKEGARTLVFGCMRDKAYAEMAQILFPVFDHVVVTPVDSPRSSHTEDLLAVAEAVGVSARAADSALNALQMALQMTPPEGLVVCAGSIYVAGPLRVWLQERSAGRNVR